jgi:hypothetical protein
MKERPILTEAQLHIVQHAVGVDQYGQGPQYRNHFVTGPSCDNYADCRLLVEAGLMSVRPKTALTGGDDCFQVTRAGLEQMKLQSPKPPRLSRSQARYRQYLRADCGLSFGQWLRLKRAGA